MIWEEMRDKIAILIIHRFNCMLERADKIIVLENGEIEDIGIHCLLYTSGEKSQEKLICRDRENTLYNQSPQESLQRVFTGSARRCIEMISERNRNKLINIDMGFQ